MTTSNYEMIEGGKHPIKAWTKGVPVEDKACQQLASQGEALAAALATIKLKDEALKEIAGSNAPHIIVAMKALVIKPDDSALKAWLGEPVAWLHENRPDADVITHAVKNVWNGVVVGRMAQYSIPLYAQKGLTKW